MHPSVKSDNEHPEARLFGELDRCARRERLVPPVVRALNRYRADAPPGEWRDTVGRLRSHPVVMRLYEDPYTSWGFRKPRGYAGDAVLLDFVYGGGTCKPLLTGLSPFAGAVNRDLIQHAASAALRARRDFLGDRLAEALASKQRPHVLAVACGHLREADSLNPASPRPGRFVALDQDPDTLAVALADHPMLPIEPIRASVLSLLRGGRDIGTFDFIYSAGLYDYLSEETGRRLTTKLAHMLAPGGSLLIANMMPDLSGAGYMEGVMDWWLIYRTVREVRKLSAGLAQDYKVRVFTRPFTAYLEISR